MDLPKFTQPKIRVSPIVFLGEVKSELKKVKWPTKKETIKMTSIVILVSILVSFIISGLDYIFTKTAALIIR